MVVGLLSGPRASLVRIWAKCPQELQMGREMRRTPGQRTVKLRPHFCVWQDCDRLGLHQHKPLFQLLIDPFSILDCSLAIWFSSWESTSFFFLLSVLDWFTTTSGTVSGQSHGNPGPLMPFIALCCFFYSTLTKLVFSYKGSQKEVFF